MSDAVQIALITNGATILTLVITRYLAHRDHLQTACKLDQVHAAVTEKTTDSPDTGHGGKPDPTV